ncbi:MAG TPA: UDP-N-acetylmuramate--L-alanine ligase [Gemmatimonadales bacterium]|nr:UDP-N-acetylmuramate--L-alanine ligase [Gemmatimonadales bacterium]
MALFDSADRRPVHFLGIGGAGMSALALIACRRGVRVTGCDADPSGAPDLAALGVAVVQGHAPSHVEGARAVVHTAAVPADHPELVRARELGIPVVPRKVALAELIAGQRVLAVSGTHGKTTTTVMATEALAALGREPTGIAGGRVSTWGGNARIPEQPFGRDSLFVVEADEYDQAFLTLSPTVAIVNNVEPDHLECYGSVPALEAAFAEFAGRAEAVFLGADDPGAQRVCSAIRAAGGRAKALTFGLGSDADIPIRGIVQSADGTTAQVTFPAVGTVTVRLQVPGVHNLRNAVGALAAVLQLAPGDPAPALEALHRFGGVGRRFERLGEAGGVAVIDDYAHHPSELVATLGAVRQAYPGRRLVAVFQPHLYSRTALHGPAMGAALAQADLVIVTEIYAAREQPMPGITGRGVADAARVAGATALFEPNRQSLARAVLSRLAPGDVVVTLGAGDITRVGPELLRQLQPA